MGGTKPWLAVATALALAGCTFHINESNLVIPRAAPTADVPAVRAAMPGATVEEGWIDTADGARLYSLAIRRAGAVATVLYFGGNGYTVGRTAPRTAAIYADLPVDVVLVDHRGYGASSGTPSIDRLLDDADLVYRRVRDDARFAGRPVVVHGHSLGSFMAGHVAALHRLDGLVLEATAPSAEEWASQLRSLQKPWIRAVVWRVKPVGPLAGKGNAEVARGLDEPVLYLVGERDTITPPRFARALFDATPLAPGRKQLVIAPGATHLDAAGTAEFRAAFSRLLADIGTPRAGTATR